MFEILVIAVASVLGMVAVCCGAFYLVWRIVERDHAERHGLLDRVQAPAAAVVSAYRSRTSDRPEPSEDDQFPVLPTTDPDLQLSELMEP